MLLPPKIRVVDTAQITQQSV